MIQFLTKNENFKVYSIYENIYLKHKFKSRKHTDFDEKDFLMAVHYGDPNGALILPSEEFAIISGCGLSIFDIKNQKDYHILDDPERITWTNGLHQDGQDDQNKEVRFVSWNSENQLRIFKIDLESKIVTEIE